MSLEKRPTFPEQWNLAEKPKPGDVYSITPWDETQEHYLATSYNKKRQLIHTSISLTGQELFLVNIYVNKMFKVLIQREPNDPVRQDTPQHKKYPIFYILICDLIPAEQKQLQKLIHDYTYSKKYKTAEGWFRGGRWDEIMKFLAKKYKMEHRFAPHM